MIHSRSFRVLWALIALVITLAGCQRAHANKQVLNTTDCGVSWNLIKTGETIPYDIGPCSYHVTIPDFPMQGEVTFKTSFKDRVLAQVEVAYEYMIVDGSLFIGEAKYLGKVGSQGDSEANSAQAYESAENAVIDKRIREMVTTLLVTEDIVEFSQAEFEDKLLAAVNEQLAEKGIKLNFISFVPIPEEQTRLAIDMMTAVKIYESRGLGELGQQVTVARAGATKIEIVTLNDKKDAPSQK